MSLEKLRALKKLDYEEVSEPAPAGVLLSAGCHQVYFEHPGETMRLATALVELVRACVERLKIGGKKGEPPAVIIAKKKVLPLPSSPGREKKFLDWIRRGAPDKLNAHNTSTTHKPRKKSPKKKVKR